MVTQTIDKPIEKLIPQPLKCDHCRRIIALYVQSEKGTQLVRGGQRVGAIWRGNMNITVKGKKLHGMPVNCPFCGFMNVIRDTPEQIAEAIRLQYNFGKPCPYHTTPDAKCTEHRPCQAFGKEWLEDCELYANYDKKVAVRK